MKAVIPAAGLGTRFLPATKAQPKEMLPVVDKPVIQYVVEEAVASGIEDILIITGRGKRSIEDHFDKSFELEQNLKQKGKEEHLREIEKITNMANIYYIRQKEQKGLGHAVLCAKKHIGNEAFAVLLGDDIIMNDVPCTKQLLHVFNKYKRSVVAVTSVPKNMVSRYGVVKGKKIDNNLYLIEDLIEKPDVDKAPSNLVLIGRYILTPEIFKCIERTKPGVGNEIQLTDAIRLLLKEQEIYAYEFKGKRYDVGNKIDWIKATIEIAMRRKDMKDELRKYLKTISEV